MNVRFWIDCYGSPVKLTLRPGQTLTWGFGCPTEEGFHRESTSWEYDSDDNCIVRDYDSASRDCDGRFDWSEVAFCPVLDLRAGYQETMTNPKFADKGEVYHWPKWKSMSHRQRDYPAEAMGY